MSAQSRTSTVPVTQSLPENLDEVYDGIIRRQRVRMLRLYSVLALLGGLSLALGLYGAWVSLEFDRARYDLFLRKQDVQRMEAERANLQQSLKNLQERESSKLQRLESTIEFMKASALKADVLPEEVSRALERIPDAQTLPEDYKELELLCKSGKGVSEACTARAVQILRTTQPNSKLREWRSASRWLEWACTEGQPPRGVHRDPSACLLLGRAYRRGTPSIKKDLAKSSSYYSLACFLGNSTGCMRAGQISYFSFKDDKANGHHLERARLLLTAACAGGDAEGCYFLAFAMNFDQSIGSMDVWRTMRRACKGRFSSACEEILKRYPSELRKRNLGASKDDGPEEEVEEEEQTKKKQ